MSAKIIINDVEFLKSELERARFSKAPKDGTLVDIFIMERNPKLYSDNKIKNLVDTDTVFTVKYYDDDDQLFGSLTDGSFFDYKLEPTSERLQLVGTFTQASS